GTKEKRDSIKTLIARGASEFEANAPQVKGGGGAILVSNPDNLFFIMSFNSKEYPFEKVGYFGNKISLPNTPMGDRSLLGKFLAEHSKILTDGLFSGVMSLRWSLLSSEKRKAKIESAGTKKIDGRKVYVLDVNPTGTASSNLNMKLYFDSETFHHVRSEYRREIDAGNVTFGRPNQNGTSVLILTEDFSDFRDEDGLNLPHVYRVNFKANSNASVSENTWGMKVSQYFFNQLLAEDFFTFDAK
ncbi:MAG TPA: hypothetical protein VHQ01_11510, partial [Pyrinomonadaceae bacterium]|nr:hypothetical protein [Pyrinomonadaceae bacterium]